MSLRALLVLVLLQSQVSVISQATQYDLSGTWLRDDGQRTSIKQTGSKLTAVKLAGGYVPAGEVTWEGEYTSGSFVGRGKLGNGKGETHWVQVRIQVLGANKIRVSGPNFDRTYIRALTEDFGCPMKGSPPVRRGDSIAPSGGRFDSTRGAGKKHGALDLNGHLGDPVYASLDGRAAVAQIGWGQMGNTVILDHGNGAYTVYGHLNSIAVDQGAIVKKGDQLGTVGYTGNASGLREAGLPPHLHFAVIQAGKSGLADAGKPLTAMKQWGDYWQGLGADLTGPVNPGLFIGTDAHCWTGSTTVNAPGER